VDIGNHHFWWLGCVIGLEGVSMSRYETMMAWEGVFAIGKGIAYLLAIACMIKYLIG